MDERKLFVIRDIPKAADFRQSTVEESKIEKEERIFEKAEVLALIQEIATAEGIGNSQLELETEYLNNEGKLICLSVRAKPVESAKQGWGDIAFTYMIKGNHGKVVGYSDATVIVRAYRPGKGEDARYVMGGIVAEYIAGNWKIEPNKIAPTGEDATPKK